MLTAGFHSDNYKLARVRDACGRGLRYPLGIVAFVAGVRWLSLIWSAAASNGSCPAEWCSGRGVVTAIAGMDRVDQVATAGNPTMGSLLNGAIVSSVI